MAEKRKPAGLSKIKLGKIKLVLLLVCLSVAIAASLVALKSDSKDSKSKQARSNQATKLVNKSADTPRDQHSGWKQYTNQDFGIEFKYPGNWETEEVEISNAGSASPVIFAVNLKTGAEEKYNVTAQLEVSKDTISSVTKFYDDYYNQSPDNKVTKQEATDNGVRVVRYVVDNAGSKTKLSVWSSNNRTYVFSSSNEELNVQRSSTYWSDFDKVFDSLTTN